LPNYNIVLKCRNCEKEISTLVEISEDGDGITEYLEAIFNFVEISKWKTASDMNQLCEICSEKEIQNDSL